MPEFLITSPDGRKFRVTAPEGAKQEEVLSRVREHAEKNPPQAAAPAQPEPAPQAAAPQKSSGGVIGQGLLGAAEGLASPVTKIFRGYEDWKKNPIGSTPQFGPSPQNKGEEYARSIGSAVGNPQSYVGGVPKAAVGAGGALVRAILSAAGGGAGAQAGGDIGGTPGAIIGGIAGGALGGAIEKPKAPVSNVPTTSEIGAAAKGTYAALAAAKHPVDPLAANVFVESAKKALTDVDFFPAETPKTFSFLERLTNPEEPPTSSTVMSVRRQLSRVIRQAHTDPDEAAAAALARRHLDQFFEENTSFGPQLKEANANYRAGKTAQSAESQQLKGELTAASQQPGMFGGATGEDATMRASLRQLLLNPKFNASGRVKEEMENVIRGGKYANFMRWAGKYMPTTQIREMAKSLGAKSTGSRIDMINEMIRLESPLAARRGSTPTPPTPTRGGEALRGAARGATTGVGAARFYEE